VQFFGTVFAATITVFAATIIEGRHYQCHSSIVPVRATWWRAPGKIQNMVCCLFGSEAAKQTAHHIGARAPTLDTAVKGY
jgi:hypothetical protein